MSEGVIDDFRLLMDLLRHEVPVIALVDEKADAEARITGPPTLLPLTSRISTPLRASTAESPSRYEIASVKGASAIAVP
jgi:hypothetical protein